MIYFIYSTSVFYGEANRHYLMSYVLYTTHQFSRLKQAQIFSNSH